MITIGIADLHVSKDAGATLVTYSLGSCIGLSVYDPVARVGGILHYMLPESQMDQEKARKNPAMFADTGIPVLFKECYRLGAEKKRMMVKVAGGSQILDESGYFNIGKRNYAALRNILWRNNVLIDCEDVGGTVSRTLYLDISTGDVRVKLPGKGIKGL